jgi:HEAT repeat protein
MEELEKKLANENEELRRAAVEELGHLISSDRSAEAKNLVIKALGDDSWRVRKTAVEVILANLDSFSKEKSLVINLIEALRADDNAGLRNSSIELLTTIGDDAIEILVKTLDDKDPDIRKFVTDIIGEIYESRSGQDTCSTATRKVVEALSRALRDSDDNVRGSASEALGKIGGKGVIDSLVSALKQDDLWLRFSALEALARIGKEVPVEPITRFLNDPILRKAAIEALGASLSADAITHLLPALKDKRTTTRVAATVNITKILSCLSDKQKKVLAPNITQAADSSLTIELLNSPSNQNKKAAIALLEVINSVNNTHDGAEELIALTIDESLRESIMSAFFNMPGKGLKSLIQIFPDASDNTKPFICSLLGRIGGNTAIETLSTALNEPYGHTRQSALRSLGSIGGHDILSKVMALLEDEYIDVQEAAIEATASIGRKFPLEVLDIIANHKADKSAKVRQNLVTVLGSIGVKEALGQVTLALKDEDKDVRKSAATALGRLALPEALEDLALALADEESSVRTAAVLALNAFPGNVEAGKMIGVAASDDDLWVRIAALKGLALYPNEKSFEILGSALVSSEAPAALTAIDILYELKEHLQGKLDVALSPALSHKDAAVVQSAERKLALLKNSDN